MLGGAWDKAKALWDRLWPSVQREADAKKAVDDVVKEPGEAMAVDALAWQLRKLLIGSPGLTDELAGLLDDVKRSARDAGVSVVASGTRSVAVGVASGGVHVSTGDGSTPPSSPGR